MPRVCKAVIKAKGGLENSTSTKQRRWSRNSGNSRGCTPLSNSTGQQWRSLKFLGVHITDNLKWTTHTDSSTSGGQRNLACHLKPSQIFTAAQSRASCWAVSLPGTQQHRTQLQGPPEGGAFCPTYCQGQITSPPGHLQHPMSKECQKDHQPPEPLPVHPLSSRRRGQ
jgi:hypothetical protein